MVFKEYFIDTLSKKLVNCRSRRPKVFLKNLQKSQENTCVGVSYLVKLQSTCNFIKKETPKQVLSCEFCKIFMNNFFYRTPPIAASVIAQQRFVGLQEVLKTSWRHVLKTSSARLQRNNFSSSKTSWRCLEDVFARRLEDILKTSWRRMIKTNIFVWRRMSKANIFVLIKTSWRRLLKTKTKGVFKTSSSRRMFAGW